MLLSSNLPSVLAHYPSCSFQVKCSATNQKRKPHHTRTGALIGIGAVLSLPAIFLNVSGSTGTCLVTFDFGDALWNVRGLDVLLQALVILTVALGIAIVLYEKEEKGVNNGLCHFVTCDAGYRHLWLTHQPSTPKSLHLSRVNRHSSHVELRDACIPMGIGLGQAFLVLAFSTDTAVSGVILALLVIVSKRYGTSDIGKIIARCKKKKAKLRLKNNDTRRILCMVSLGHPAFLQLIRPRNRQNTAKKPETTSSLQSPQSQQHWRSLWCLPSGQATDKHSTTPSPSSPASTAPITAGVYIDPLSVLFTCLVALFRINHRSLLTRLHER